MISCDDCQKKIVAVFDSEGKKADEELVSIHVKGCAECRAFQEDMVRIRQASVSAAVPSPPASMGQEVMRQVEAGQQRDKKLRPAISITRESVWLRFPRLAWASGVAALFLIVASWLVCFVLARKVVDLRHELRVARQEVAVARAQRRSEEDRDKEQRAITALYLRMAEWERRIERGSLPGTSLLPVERLWISDRQDDL